MKYRIPLVFSVLAFASIASAQTLSSANINSQTQSSTSAASTDGNQQAINIAASVIPTETRTNVNYSGTQTVKNVPSVSGPNLISSNDTCMGSASGSANGPGFGISIGKTYTDSNCVMLKNSRELWNMGMKAAALAIMCKDTDNREALELTGFECPQITRERKNADQLKMSSILGHSTPAPFELTDPIVRARLGLAPL